MKEGIKNTAILEKTVKPDNGKTLKRVQDDMGWLRCLFGALAPDKVVSLFTAHFSQRCAFTLAEVLITLGIIGVVAAMTMPSLIQKYQERETVVKVKKIYSIFSNAFMRARTEYGDMSEWGLLTENDKSTIFADKVLLYLKVIKVCGYEKGCFPDVIYEYMDKKPSNWYYIHNSNIMYKFILSDGTIAGIEERPTFASVFFDVNGDKGPNVLGKDLFAFSFAKEKAIPFCSFDDTQNIVTDCRLNHGQSSLAWIILNDNMDYLHCPDELDFNGKTKCK